MKAKRILLIGLVLALSVCLAGCKNDDVQNDVSNENNDTVISGNISDSNENDGEDINDENENLGEDVTGNSGDTNVDVSGELVATEESATNIMTALAAKATLMVNAPMQEAIPADQATTFIGLSQEDFEANVVDSVFYESMMSPANQSFCLIKVKEGADVATLKQTIFDNCNPRKWICMSAERVVVIDSGSYILLGMGAKDSCDSILTEFKAYFNNNVGETLDKLYEENIELEPDMLAE